MEEKDLGLVLQGRNHPRIRKQSIVTKPVSKRDHQKWFETTPLIKKFIFEFQKQPVGMILLEYRDPTTVTWSFFLYPEVPRSIGLGTLMCSLALNYCMEQGVRRVCGAVLKTNTRSRKLHEKFAFKIFDEFKAGRKEVLVYELPLYC